MKRLAYVCCVTASVTALSCDPARPNQAAIDAAPAAPTCEAYCTMMESVCAEKDGGYPGSDAATRRVSCIAHCNEFVGIPIGTSEDMSGNTLGCRIYHIENVGRTGDASHCRHASAAGGNHCGLYCESYCYIVTRNCTGANAQYTNEAECLSRCDPCHGKSTAECDPQATGNEGLSREEFGDLTARAGDTVQCRTNYAIEAATELPRSAVDKCPSAGFASPLCK